MSKTPVNKKPIRETLSKAMDSLPLNNKQAIEDAHVYVTMTEEGLNRLPAFWDDGSVRFYEVGGILLGKQTLVHFINSIKNGK